MVQKLSEGDIAAIKSKLLAMQEEILCTLAQAKSAAATVELDQNRMGRLSRMDAMQGQEMARAGLARQQDILVRVTAALAEIHEPSFGQCRECDNWIAVARLKFDPTAVHCVDCASSLEAS